MPTHDIDLIKESSSPLRRSCNKNRSYAILILADILSRHVAEPQESPDICIDDHWITSHT